MHWIRVDRYYEGPPESPETYHQPHALPALREGPLRGRLPGGGDRAQRGGPQRHGLQPLRRHAVLLEQLPVQGAPLQLPALPGLGDAVLQDDAEPRGHGALARRHGEVHLLRAAHRPHADRREERAAGRSGTARSRPPASRPARRRRSSSATSTTRRAASRSCASPSAATASSPSCRPSRGRRTSLRSATRTRRCRAPPPGRRTMASGARVETPATVDHPIIGPGHTFAIGHRQDREPRPLEEDAARLVRRLRYRVRDPERVPGRGELPAREGHRDLGHQRPRRRGASRSSTSSGGSGSATPGRSSRRSCCCCGSSGARRSTASPRR